jgi:hypothetical protein
MIIDRMKPIPPNPTSPLTFSQVCYFLEICGASQPPFHPFELQLSLHLSKGFRLPPEGWTPQDQTVIEAQEIMDRAQAVPQVGPVLPLDDTYQRYLSGVVMDKVRSAWHTQHNPPGSTVKTEIFIQEEKIWETRHYLGEDLA